MPTAQVIETFKTKRKEQSRKSTPAPSLSELANYPRALTVRQVAALTSTHPLTVYKLIRQGRLPSFSIGSAVRVSPQKLAAWLSERGA